jgi:tetratricopeptide (TPR) repeat protein
MSGAEFVAVLGITASASQVIEAGGKILHKIQEFRSNISAFRHLEDQLPLFIHDVQALTNAISDGLMDEPSEHMLSRVLSGCSAQLVKLEKLVESVSLSKASSRSKKVFRALRSYAKDSAIRETLGILSQYQHTITMHLSTQAALSRKRDGEVTPDQRPLSVLPSLRVPHFVGRHDILKRLDHLFTVPNERSRSNIAVLSGLGGQGKTQIALEFCHRISATGATVLWIDASSPDATLRSFEKIANEIGMGKPKGSDLDDLFHHVKRDLETRNNPFVLVFDNYDAPGQFNDKEISQFFPRSPGNHLILVTSRRREVERLGTPIYVDGLDEKSALELLTKQAMIPDDNQSPQELDSVRKVVRTMAYHALAIAQAAAYIRLRNISLDVYMKIYENYKERVLSETPKIAWEYQKVDGQDFKLRALSVRTTFELSLSQIPVKDRPKIENFLTQAAFFDPFNISEEVFSAVTDNALMNVRKQSKWTSLFISTGGWDSFNFQEIVVSLMNLSLVQSISYSGQFIHFALHPLVKEWLQFRCSHEERLRYTFHSLAMTAVHSQPGSIDGFDFAQRQHIMANMDHCLQNLKRYVRTTEEQRAFSGIHTGYITTIATFLGSHDREKEAENLFLKVQNFYQQALGTEDSILLRNQNNLGALYLSLRRIEEAEGILRDTYWAKVEKLGYTHYMTLNTLLNIANLHMLQGDYKEACQKYNSFIQTYKNFRRSNDIAALRARNNLGEAMLKMRRFDLAESNFRCLVHDIHSASETKGEIPIGFILYVKANYALILRIQGKLRESVRLYKEVIEGGKSVFGPDHSATLGAQEELSHVFQGKPRIRSVSVGLHSPQDLQSWTHGATRRVRSIGDLITSTRSSTNDSEVQNTNPTVAQWHFDPVSRVNGYGSVASGLPDPLRVNSQNPYVSYKAASNTSSAAGNEKDWVKMPPNAKATDALDWKAISTRRYVQYNNVDPGDYWLTGDVDYYRQIQRENFVLEELKSLDEDGDEESGNQSERSDPLANRTPDSGSMAPFIQGRNPLSMLNQSEVLEDEAQIGILRKLANSERIQQDAAPKEESSPATEVSSVSSTPKSFGPPKVGPEIPSIQKTKKKQRNSSSSKTLPDTDPFIQSRTGRHGFN